MLIGCDSGSNSVSQENNDSIGVAQKSQIKEFWQIYREAQQYRKNKDFESAAALYRNAIQIDSTHEDSWFNLGNMYLELNQNVKARNCWRHIIRYNNSSARAHMQLGRLYLAHERQDVFNIESAKMEFQLAFELNKIVTGPLMSLGHVALIKREIASAAEYFRAVAGSDARSVEARFLLGYIYWSQGKRQESMRAFEEAISVAVPEEAMKGTLSEGDTKDGKSHLRPINQSIFYSCFSGLQSLEGSSSIEAVMEARYRRTQDILDGIRRIVSLEN